MKLAEGHDEADRGADRINVVIPRAANQSPMILPEIRRSPEEMGSVSFTV